MLAIVDDDHTLVQCFENAGHLVEPFGLFEFQENPRTPAHGVDVHLTQSWPERQKCLLTWILLKRWRLQRFPNYSKVVMRG